MTGKPIVILGSGGHARVVVDACLSSGGMVAGHLDRGSGHGLQILGNDERLDDPEFIRQHEFIVGIGDQQVRRRLSSLVREKGGVLATVIHGSAVIAPDVQIGQGTVVMAGCVINPGAVVGDFVIVNTGATVDHDSVLADGVHVCPGVNLAGGVSCGEGAFIGTGAVVTPGRVIGQDAIVGAGSVVLSDVADGATVAGSPASPIRS